LSPTATLTSSPDPACGPFRLNGWVQSLWNGGTLPTIFLHLINSGPSDAGVTRIDLAWDGYHQANPSQVLDQVRYNYAIVASADDPDPDTSLTLNPAQTSPAGSYRTILFDFKNPDTAWPGIAPAGSFGLTVTLDNGCVLSRPAVPIPTNAPTAAP
jgi:hypothetical protein